MLRAGTSARFPKVVRRDTANLTDQELVAAPGADRRIVVDQLYFNTLGTQEVQFKQATGAWANADGVMGGSFGANGGFINETHLELGENKPLVVSTIGTATTTFIMVIYHIES